jgi:hypothetical protein
MIASKPIKTPIKPVMLLIHDRASSDRSFRSARIAAFRIGLEVY